MDRPSTAYDCSKWEPHKAYVAEVVRKSRDVDFRKYAIVYIVGSKNPGTPISPTWRAWPGDGVRAGAAEVRHAVTFGNDCRKPNSGWQTLVHETGHVFGLPDLYSFDRGSGTHKDIHKYVGFWDFMGWQPAASDHLAWHKYKLGWLSDKNLAVVRKGPWSGALTPMGEPGGIKAVVVPTSDTVAYVAEVRTPDGRPASDTGVLCYKVSLTRGDGEGPIQVLPAKDDDGRMDLSRKVGHLRNALFFGGVVLNDPDHRVKVEVAGREGSGYKLRVTR
jgi:M6 family metalloprotease-like protein